MNKTVGGEDTQPDTEAMFGDVWRCLESFQYFQIYKDTVEVDRHLNKCPNCVWKCVLVDLLEMAIAGGFSELL